MKVAAAVASVVSPIKMNYEIHRNTLPHRHPHLCPRHLDDPFVGGPSIRRGWPRFVGNRRSCSRSLPRSMLADEPGAAYQTWRPGLPRRLRTETRPTRSVRVAFGTTRPPGRARYRADLASEPATSAPRRVASSPPLGIREGSSRRDGPVNSYNTVHLVLREEWWGVKSVPELSTCSEQGKRALPCRRGDTNPNPTRPYRPRVPRRSGVICCSDPRQRGPSDV
jgi:hypothetical protein